MKTIYFHIYLAILAMTTVFTQNNCGKEVFSDDTISRKRILACYIGRSLSPATLHNKKIHYCIWGDGSFIYRTGDDYWKGNLDFADSLKLHKISCLIDINTSEMPVYPDSTLNITISRLCADENICHYCSADLHGNGDNDMHTLSTNEKQLIRKLRVYNEAVKTILTKKDCHKYISDEDYIKSIHKECSIICN